VARVAVRIFADDLILEAGVKSHLRTRPEITLLAEPCDTGGDPVVNLVVTEMLDESTLQTLQRIRAGMTAGASTAVPAVLLVGRIEVNDLPQAAACGVRALLYRHLATPDRIVSTIVAAANGEGVIPGDLLSHLLTQVGQLHREFLNPTGMTLSGLTARETQILKLASEGYDTAGIARRVGFSERTVKSLLHGVVVRYGLRNRTHAVAHAIREGMV
jgi:DNA-binding NarL/FixJ family response regulator